LVAVCLATRRLYARPNRRAWRVVQGAVFARRHDLIEACLRKDVRNIEHGGVGQRDRALNAFDQLTDFSEPVVREKRGSEI
jgi:hypothetical protein